VTTGFGRKGLVLGQEPAQRAGFGRAGIASHAVTVSPVDDELAQRRAAFLAAERARADVVTGGLTDAARQFTYAADRPQRSMVLAYVLWFFFCTLSAHRFYLGATQSALLQAGLWIGGGLIAAIGVLSSVQVIAILGGMAMIGSAVWQLLDLFLIPGVHRQYCA
jgi:hypothetical protein